MRHGTEATWQSPGGPRVAQVALTRGAGGADAWQKATWTGHAGARVGRHVACGGW